MAEMKPSVIIALIIIVVDTGKRVDGRRSTKDNIECRFGQVVVKEGGGALQHDPSSFLRPMQSMQIHIGG